MSRRGSESDQGKSDPASLIEVFTSFSSVKRPEILAALTVKSMTVTEVAQVLGYDLPDVSKNLKALREAGLLAVERVGRQRIHRVSDHVRVRLMSPFLRVYIRTAQSERLAFDVLVHPSTLRLIDAVQPPSNGHRNGDVGSRA